MEKFLKILGCILCWLIAMIMMEYCIKSNFSFIIKVLIKSGVMIILIPFYYKMFKFWGIKID